MIIFQKEKNYSFSEDNEDNKKEYNFNNNNIIINIITNIVEYENSSKDSISLNDLINILNNVNNDILK